MLSFFNAVAEASGWTKKPLGLKAEALVHALPPTVSTRTASLRAAGHTLERAPTTEPAA